MLRAPGSFTSKFKLRSNAEGLAGNMPALLLQAHHLAATIDVGQHGRRKAGPGEDFWQFKHYTQGDGRSEIDWRQSAKRGEVFIRQKELESSENAWFWINHEETMSFKSKSAPYTKLEFANLITLSLLILLNKADENFAVLGKMPKCTHGTSQLDAATTALSEKTATPFENDLLNSKISSKSQLILTSDFLRSPEALKSQLRNVAANGSKGLLLHIADPAEITLPYSGRTTFHDMHGNPVISFKQVQNIRGDYQKAFAQHQKTLKEIAAQTGLRYLFCSSDAAPADVIARTYQVLSEGT